MIIDLPKYLYKIIEKNTNFIYDMLVLTEVESAVVQPLQEPLGLSLCQAMEIVL